MKNKFDIEERWNEEYRKGAHWEKEHNSRATEFRKALRPKSKILDAGCGSGRNSIYFASLGHKVLGIDISSVAIEKARLKNHSIDYTVGNLEALPYQQSYFDAIYCAYTLSATKTSKVIQEFSRVLKEGGLCCIICLYETEYPNNSFFNNKLDFEKTISCFKKYFTIIDEKYDEYGEEDEHGRHRHKRGIINLRKRNELI